MGNAVRERVGLARARAGDDQQRAGVGQQRSAMLNRSPLLRIELFEIGLGGPKLPARRRPAPNAMRKINPRVATQQL